jgi:hypothetical protein
MASRKQAAAVRRNARLRRRPKVGVDAQQRAARIARSSPAAPHVRFRMEGASVGRLQSARRSLSRNLLEIRYGPAVQDLLGTRW